MAIPDAPQTRGEQYLNAIALGDASGIPEAPQTREEMYLDAIAKNGGGGASDEPFILHGTMTSDTGGTIEETPESLAAAITARKRIILNLAMPGTEYIADLELMYKLTAPPITCVSSFAVGDDLTSFVVTESNGALVFVGSQHQLAST